MPAKSTRTPKGAVPYSKKILDDYGPQRTFTGQNLDQIAFPLGGMGAGQINLGGSGDLIDFSIHNTPALGTHPMAFATVTAVTKGKEPVARVIEGPVTQSRVFRNGQLGRGHLNGHEGFPHMAAAKFKGEFPFARIDFNEPDLPVQVSLEAWSPFIPLDDLNSSIPSAILTYTVRNRSQKPVDATVAFHLSHMIPIDGEGRTGHALKVKKSKAANGLFYYNKEFDAGDPRYATFALATTAPNAIMKAGWFRGAWFDSRTMLWKEIESGQIATQNQSKPVVPPIRPNSTGGTVAIPLRLKPGQTGTATIILAWHTPQSAEVVGYPKPPNPPEGSCCDGDSCCSAPVAPKTWTPYYAVKWKDAWAVAQHVAKNFDSLQSRTRRFRDVFFSTTAPSYVLDAVSANLGILKSPTVLRMADGALWGWEGCHPETGCCTGSCTHVWNYAQAVPHLFPAVERSLRSQELKQSMRDDGYVRFRAQLPPKAYVAQGRDVPAADGQLGGIMKVYRDWQICGDDDWLRCMYPLAKSSLEYCIGLWDPDERGALFEMHHNTYDIEFYGPDVMCTSVYLGALRAATAMARHLEIDADAGRYGALADKGSAFCDANLFNGEYYHQKIMKKGLHTNYTQSHRYIDEKPEVKALCKKEGPKYQYGDGCLSDGVIGQWFAEAYGVPAALDRENTRATLKSIFRHNFKKNLRQHANPQRALFALNDEAGLLLCSWPRGGKLSLPFVYSDEVWTGIEYQVASHLIYEGLVDEGLTVVKAVRDRYEGFVRNPWNEYECGSYYARAMSSYAVLTALGGFRYSAVTEELTVNPRLDRGKFVSFFSTDKAWGRFTVTRAKSGAVTVKIEVEEGRLPIRSLSAASPNGKKGTQPKTVRLPKKAIAKPGAPVVVRLDR